MTKDEALKMALEALEADPLEMVADVDGHMVFRKEQAITAMEKLLAQPEQEPMAWISTGPARMIHWTSDKPAYGDDWVPLYTTSPRTRRNPSEALPPACSARNATGLHSYRSLSLPLLFFVVPG